MPHKSKYAFAESKGISQENKMSAPETNETNNIFASNPPSEEMESVPPQEPITASQAAEAESEVADEKAPQVEEGEEEEEDDSDYYPDDYYESQSYVSHNDYYDDGYGLDWNESGYFD